MSKICPNCQTEFDDSHGFCSNCGSRLVDKQEFANPALNLGDANAISGGVSINQSKNITSHETHYHSTTIERVKSDAEIQLDSANQLRAKAEEIMTERGRIDSVAMGQLRPMALQLGIEDEKFKAIIKDVRSSRNGNASGLSAANARYLQQAQQAIQTNDMDILSNLTPRLEAMAAISQDDDVQYLYHLTLSILYPIKSMEIYDRQTDENYWRAFWAIVSNIRTGNYARATGLLALFDPLRFEKSEDDQNLLEAYFNIMKDDKDGAQEFLDEILGEPAAIVMPLLRAVESTLYEEEPDNLEVRFYMERVMTKSDVEVTKKGKTQEAIEETKPESPAEEQKENIEAKKEVPTSAKFDSKEAESLYSKACAASGIKRVMLLQKAAEAGCLDAMYDLGDCFWDGEGVDKNIELSVKWMQKAADLGHLSAQTALGVAFFHGIEGLDQNYALSEKYLLMAAEREDMMAQAALSSLYFQIEEYQKSLVWARKAAQKEQPMACMVLGRLYDEGLGIEVDHLEGLKWFEKAANGGNADAQNVVGNIYANADYVEHDYQKAFEYYQKAAAQGHLEGMCNLGWCYQEGLGTDVNLMFAEEWIRKAADGGLQEAIDILNSNPICNQETETYDKIDKAELLKKASIFFEQKDYQKAIEIWRNLADNGDAESMRKLGNCYIFGQGVNKDFLEAVNWLHKAAELGDADAMVNLGVCYINGNGVQQDYSEEIKWYRKSVESGNANAMLNLGNCYLNGNGVKQDYSMAGKMYAKAIALNNPYGMSAIGFWYEKRYDYPDALYWYQKSLNHGRANDEWIKERINYCNSRVNPPKNIVYTPENKGIVELVHLDYYKSDYYSSDLHFYYSLRFSEYVGTVKVVSTIKSHDDGTVITKHDEFEIDTNEKVSLDGFRELRISGLYKESIIQCRVDEMNISNSGKYSYSGEFSVFDKKSNLLLKAGYDLRIKYKHSLFKKDEVKVI